MIFSGVSVVISEKSELVICLLEGVYGFKLLNSHDNSPFTLFLPLVETLEVCIQTSILIP